LLCWVKVHWGFYKVLTIYQIYHTWTHHLHHSPFSSFSILGAVSSGLIFPFTYTCTQYLYHIHPPTPFPTSLPLSWVPTFPQLSRTCSVFLFANIVKEKKKDIFSCLRQIHGKFPCGTSMYICIITWIGSSLFFFFLP
jgi:hypothetical protein